MEKEAVEEKGLTFRPGVVSIVTPVYNGAKYLPLMLDSVLRQTYEHIEMILVDDGSCDQTLAVAKTYCDKFSERGYGYRIVRAAHRNASAAINRGLPFVTGEYLIWPDSDDVLEAESVKRRVLYLQQNPQYQCVRTLSYYFREEDFAPVKAEEKRGDPLKEDIFWDILEGNTFVCCGCYMLRTESFFEIYRWRKIPEYDVGQNFQMLLPFMFYHKCPTIQEALYGVRCRVGSHSRRELSRREEEKKYTDYEEMVDEIAKICNIYDKGSQRRILRWKVGRRYQLACKYGQKKQALRALCQLYRYGGYRNLRGFKEILWLFYHMRRGRQVAK